MGKYFELIKLTKNHILILLLPLFYVSTVYLKKVQMKVFDHNNYEYWDCHEASDKSSCPKMRKIEFFFNIFSSKILSIFPFLYVKFVKCIKKNKDLASGQNKPMNINTTIIRKIIIGFLIIIISILEYLYRYETYLTIKMLSPANIIDMKLGIVFLIPILSFFIINNNKIYLRHIISFILFSLGVFLIIVFLNKIYQEGDYYGPDIRFFKDQWPHLSCSIYPSLAFVLTKVLFENYNLDVFLFLLVNGILGFMPFFYIIYDKYIFDVLFLDFRAIYSFIGVFISSFGYYLVNTLIIYKFSPNILVISEILALFLKWIIEIIFQNKEENEESYIIIIKIAGFLIMFISASVYNEIIILHFFNCDKNIENQSLKEDELEKNDNSNTLIILKD